MTSIQELLRRARKTIAVTFLLTFAVLLAVVFLKPDHYQAHMSFLVRNERAESLVSGDPAQNAMPQTDATEERINSDVELLGSSELLGRVVRDSQLEREYLNMSGSNVDEAVEKATRKLSKNLEIVGVRKSAIINVTYTSKSQSQAKTVLDSLSKEYLAAYNRLHAVGGVASFFEQKTATLEDSLHQLEQQRADVLARDGYMVLPEGQRILLEQLADLNKQRNDTVAELADTNQRLIQAKLERARAAVRITTQRRIQSNPYSVEQLNTKLADLKNQRTVLRTKFLDNDPLVRELDQEIADTQAALTRSETIQSEDTTEDVNPINQSLESEINRLTQIKAGLEAKLATLDKQIATQTSAMAKVEQGSIASDNLDSQIKTLRDDAELYRSKAVAARSAEELDSNKYSNVVEATHPVVPALPDPSPLNVVSAFLLSVLISIGVGLGRAWNKDRRVHHEQPVLVEREVG